MPIYVLSYRRAKTCTTPALMRMYGFKHVTLCVRRHELDEYQEALGKGYRYLALPDNVDGLAGTRQTLLDTIDDSYYVMMDDDIRRFSYKPDIRKFGGLRQADFKDVLSVFRQMRDEASGSNFLFAGSIPDRFTVAHPSKVSYQDYGFMRQCLFMGAKLRDYVRFDRLRVFLDIDYSLQVAKAGIPMLVSRNLCIESVGDAYDETKGGLGAERQTMLRKAGSQEEYDKRVWSAIQKLHPDVIKLEPRRRIDWRGAYKIGLEKRDD